MNLHPRLPKHWTVSPLSQACTKITDGTHHSPNEQEQTKTGDYLYITAKNIKEYGVDLANVTYLPERIHRAIYVRCDPEAGDVLYIKDGVTTGVATVNQLDEEFSLLSSVALMKPRRELIEPRFLKWYLNSPIGFRSMTAQMTGTAIKRLTLTKIKSSDVVVAPMAEQRRIVAKIEELFSDLDAGVAALQRVKANLKRYRAAVLNAAVTGKLTADWRKQNPPAESADKLLARTLEERRKKWEADQLRKFAEAGKTPPKGWREKYASPVVADGDELASLPRSWTWSSLDSLCVLIADIDHNMPKAVTDGVKFLSAKDLRDDGTLNFTEDVKLISEEDYARLSRKARPQRDDIIYSRIGACLGKARRVENDERFLVSYSCCTIRTLPRCVDPAYLAYYLDSGSVLRQARSSMQSIGVPDLGLDRIKRFAIPLCVFDEQRQIASELDRRLTTVRAIEADVEHNLKRAARLRQAILKRAFEGKLVPQNPSESIVAAASGITTAPPPQAGRGRVKRVQRSSRVKRKHRRGIAFDRAAVMAHIVHRLGKCRNFGRTEAMKTLYLGESWLGIDLELEPVREKLGPLDPAIYRVENLARKQGWFTSTVAGPMIRYEEGPGISGRLTAAKRIIGAKLADFDRLLNEIGKMETEQAELFATTFAVWNDLLLDQRPANDDAIIAEVHQWHPTKVEKFPADRIVRCIGWMKSQGFVPTGTGPRSEFLDT
jgi:type I restriction enzyme S subunit